MDHQLVQMLLILFVKSTDLDNFLDDENWADLDSKNFCGKKIALNLRKLLIEIYN